MKKQLFSFVMMLAIVVLAGTSAWAQTGDPTDPFYHVNNSTHTFSVTANASNTFGWAVFTNAGADVTADANHVTAPGATNTNSFGFTWSNDANGMYYVQVTETTADGCVTIRRIYVFLVNFDVHVFVSNDLGGNREGATDYRECGEGTVANYGDLSGAAFSQTVNIDGAGTDGDLSSDVGTAHRSERYISLRIIWNAPANGTYDTDFAAPTVLAMTYTAAVTTDAGTDFISIGNVNSTAGTVTETNVQGDGVTFTSTMVLNARWGRDQNVQVEATNVTLFSDAGATVRLGTELNSNVQAHVQGVDGTAPYQNTTDNQIILGAPATSVITVAP